MALLVSEIEPWKLPMIVPLQRVTPPMELIVVPEFEMTPLLNVTPPIELEAFDVPIKLTDVIVATLLMFELFRVTPPIELEALDVPIKLEEVVVPALLMLVLFRVTPPITLLVVTIELIIAPPYVMFELDRVTPPITLVAAAVLRIPPETSRATVGLLVPTPTPPDVILIARRLHVPGAVDAVALVVLLVKKSIALLALVVAAW